MKQYPALNDPSSWLQRHKENEMGIDNQIDKSRMMGTAAFKKEINHLLYSNQFTASDGEFDAGWNCRDHSLVMALMLKSGDDYPKVASGKCMFVQGPGKMANVVLWSLPTCADETLVLLSGTTRESQDRESQDSHI